MSSVKHCSPVRQIVFQQTSVRHQPAPRAQQSAVPSANTIQVGSAHVFYTTHHGKTFTLPISRQSQDEQQHVQRPSASASHPAPSAAIQPSMDATVRLPETN